MKCSKTILALLSLTCLGSAQAQPAPAQTLLQCGRVIDVENRQIIENAAILVAGDLIEAVGTDLTVPASARRVDLKDRSCAPGLMDMHVHLAHDGGATGNPATFSRSGSWRALRSLAAAEVMLNRGFTTIRTLGFDRHFETIDVRNAINAGEHPGPRIFVAPHGVQGVGEATLLGKDANNPEGSASEAMFVIRGTGPVEMRRITAREISYGADWIKLSDAWGTGMTLEDVQAVVDEAHRHGKKVTQHITSDPEHKAARMAIAAGVDSIDHAFITDEKVLKDMARQGIFYVPTIWIIEYITRQPPGTKLTDGMRIEEDMAAMMAPMVAMLNQNTKLAHQLGVKIVMGSDTVFKPEIIADAIEEFALLAKATGDNWAALRAGTIVSAEMLGQEAQIGSIKAGKLADIVAMPGNPIDDMSAVESVDFVMKGGVQVR